MDVDSSSLPIVDNRAANRYEMILNRRASGDMSHDDMSSIDMSMDDMSLIEIIAVAHYRLSEETITFTYVGVPDAYAGRGIGSQITKFALDDAVARGLKIGATCSFVRLYIQRHREYQPYLAT